MAARLIGTTKHFAGKQFQIRSEATIGKSPGNNIVLADPSISRRHARIFKEEATGFYILEDLDSKNGSRVDGVKIFEREPLSDLQVITFGRCDFFFQKVAEPNPDSDHEVEEVNFEDAEILS